MKRVSNANRTNSLQQIEFPLRKTWMLRTATKLIAWRQYRDNKKQHKKSVIRQSSFDV